MTDDFAPFHAGLGGLADAAALVSFEPFEGPVFFHPVRTGQDRRGFVSHRPTLGQGSGKVVRAFTGPQFNLALLGGPGAVAGALLLDGGKPAAAVLFVRIAPADANDLIWWIVVFDQLRHDGSRAFGLGHRRNSNQNKNGHRRTNQAGEDSWQHGACSFL